MSIRKFILATAAAGGLARCQGARANKGFDTEQLICEGLADGTFSVNISTTHMNRAAWACVATSPTA